MVNIREVWMLVVHWRMSVPMRMRPCLINTCFMLMLVVLIMRVDMSVFKEFMDMFMLVGLGQMQPHPQPHER